MPAMLMFLACYGTIFNPSSAPKPQGHDNDADFTPLDTATEDTGVPVDSTTPETGDSGAIDSAADSGDSGVTDVDTGGEVPTGPVALAASAQFAGDTRGMLGMALATGDVNGDGTIDLVMGAPGFDPEEVDHHAVDIPTGYALVAFGPLTTASTSVRLLGDTPWDMAGGSLAIGDVDGDAVNDVVVGAPMAASENGAVGAVYVARGPIVGDVSLRDGEVAHGEFDLGFFGGSMALLDWDGDGVDDIVTGAMNTDLVSVFATSRVDFHGVATGDRFGWDVAGGDLTGDGVDELVVGAPLGNGGWEGTGMAYVYSPTGETFAVVGAQAKSWFGKALALADMNADGYGDLLASAPQDSEVFILRGPLTGDVTMPHASAAVLRDDQNDGDVGESLALAGDRNADGHEDLVVGGYTYDPDVRLPDAGRGWLVLGPFDGVVDMAAVSSSYADGGYRDDRFGKAVAATPDVLIMAAPYASIDASRTGSVYVYDE